MSRERVNIYQEMIIEGFVYVDPTLFMFLYLFFHQISLSGETELLQYAEYFKSWRVKSQHMSKNISEHGSISYLPCCFRNCCSVLSVWISWTRDSEQRVFVYLFGLVTIIRCCQWTSSCFDRLLCGPESCKTESYSFLTGVSITLIRHQHSHVNNEL